MKTLISRGHAGQLSRAANRVACSKIKLLLVSTCALQLIPIQSAKPQLPPAERQLTMELPACSLVRAKLERGVSGSGIDEPYMAAMRQQGVQRALFDVQAVLRHANRPEDLRVVRRLYFRQFDGADSQISDEATLQAIEASGLAAELDNLARSRALAAPLVRGPEFVPFMGNKVGSIVEFFGNAWLPEQNVSLTRSGHRTALTEAIQSQDALQTQTLLRSHKFAKKELNLALFMAVRNHYDNSAVIKLLLNAGADVNARTGDGVTPLMNSVTSPCNPRPLLDGGADVNSRDKWGRNALQVAQEEKQAVAIRFLQKGEF